MKYLFLIIFLSVGFLAQADTFVITVTTEEVKAVNSIVVDADAWLQKAWDMKAANCIDRAILEQTDKNPNKLTEQQKIDLIKNTDLKTRKEKDAE